MDGISVYKSRLSMGEALADQVIRAFGNNMDIDVVIPVSTIFINVYTMHWTDVVIRFLIQVVLLPSNFLVNSTLFIAKASTRTDMLVVLLLCRANKQDARTSAVN